MRPADNKHGGYLLDVHKLMLMQSTFFRRYYAYKTHKWECIGWGAVISPPHSPPVASLRRMGAMSRTGNCIQTLTKWNDKWS